MRGDHNQDVQREKKSNKNYIRWKDTPKKLGGRGRGVDLGIVRGRRRL